MRLDERAVGRRLPRGDAEERANGSTQYVDDMVRDDMLHGAILRSAQPHARLTAINVAAARSMKGVRAILTAADLPVRRHGLWVRDTEILARDRVLYHGHPVALVAADSPEIAERAVRAIEITYEPLPPIVDPEIALLPETPPIHPGWPDYDAEKVYPRSGNAVGCSTMRHGDPERLFGEAFRTYEHRFTTQIMHAGYLEPRVAIAEWEGSDRLTVWTTAQLPFEIRSVLAGLFDLTPAAVRVVVPAIGGAFGGKLRIGMEHYAAALARAAGRPVKVRCSLEEELLSANPRQPAILTIRSAVTRDGLILAKSGEVVVDCGAFAGTGPGVAAIAMQLLAGPYRCEHYDYRAAAAYTNKVPTGSFRAPSGPMGNFALESHMDLIAADLGIDPLALRLKNAVVEGDRGPSGEVLHSVSLAECLRAAAEAIGWNASNLTKGRAKALACGWWMTTGGPSNVDLLLNADGTMHLTVGAVELGTGAITGAIQILADELGVPPGTITASVVDTRASRFDYGAQGSRTMFSVANAASSAASALRAQLIDLAASELGLPSDMMRLEAGEVVIGNHRIPIGGLAGRSADGRLGVSGSAQAYPEPHDPERVTNHHLPVWNSQSYHAHAVDLSVDEGTGEITIHRYVVAQDVGHAVNPMLIEGQIEGGVAQGLGQALSEELVYRDGLLLNSNLTDYKMPTALDVPRIESILIERPSRDGPHGAKGVGEPPCVEPPAAIANAVAAATGARVFSLPITPEKIIRSMGRLVTG